jgi:hypothetical protein
VSYDDFEAYGIHRHSIAPAIRETVALGFLRITRKGVAGNADHRQIAHYQLTFVRSADGEVETHDYRKFKTIKQAEEAAKLARKPVIRKNRKPVAESALKNANSIVRKPPLQGRQKPPLLSISGYGAGGREVDGGRQRDSDSDTAPIGLSQSNSPIEFHQSIPRHRRLHR